MIGYYLSLIFKWNSIARWNNFPRIENTMQTENLALVLHICTIFAKLLQEKENIKIDLNYIYKKVLFESLSNFVVSDINSDVKSRIKLINKDIIEKIDNKIYKILLWFQMPKKIKNDFENTINNVKSPDSIEEIVFKFAKLISSKIEIMYNYKIFTNVYEIPYNSIMKQIEEERFAFLNKYLDKDLHKYFEQINRLKYSFRWNRTERVTKVSVMSHLYIVFCISYFIWCLEEKNDDEILLMMKKWLLHDIPESITWDILTPTKSAEKWFREILWTVEENMIDEYLLWYIKQYKFKDELKKDMLEPFDDELGKLCKLADIFSALLEAKVEEDKNIRYKNKFESIRKILNQKEYKSIDYLMKYWVDYFSDDLDGIIDLK